MEGLDQTISEFNRHIPKLLRQQLLCELVNQYLCERKFAIPTTTTSTTTSPSSLSSGENPFKCQPSIQRFHGALLFVDISGFTALSLRLDVDTLKNHINNYFTKMLEIVDKWGGDVIKFAGDALFIVWPTDIHSRELKLSSLGKEGGKETIRSVNLGNENSSDIRFVAAARAALEKAVACGLEITISCGHHEVQLGNGTGDGTDQKKTDSLLGKILPNWMLNAAASPSKIAPELPNLSSQTDNVAYLDVHCGVSIGLMAGVDIGHLDRWEFFLVGDPIANAAAAEAQAAKGEVVLCQRAHRLLHRKEGQQSSPMDQMEFVSIRSPISMYHAPHHTPNSNVSCGCTKTPGGLFCVSTIDVKLPQDAREMNKFKRARSKTKLEEYNSQNETNQKNQKFLDDITSEFDKVFGTISSTILKRKFWEMVHENIPLDEVHHCGMNTIDENDSPSGRVTQTGLSILTSPPKNTPEKDAVYYRICKSVLREHFLEKVKAAVLDDVARHVHDVARNDFHFDPNFLQQCGTLKQLIDSYLPKVTVEEYQSKLLTSGNDCPTFIEKSLTAWVEAPLTNHNSASSSGFFRSFTNLNPNETSITNRSSTHSSSSRSGDLLNSPIDARLRQKSLPSSGSRPKRSSLQFISAEASSLSELRSVTVLFIKIDAFDLNLVVDTSKKTRGFKKPQSAVYDAFRFLDRTENELTADMVLLQKFQSCIEVLINALYNFKGQLRQFIVDDKGTVCIGTFGLKGSVANDNAAAALEAAKTIIDGVERLDLSASIGITTGKAYCGLVGSVSRHEYAVMGPSTNLSARLMGKAPANEVICDTETKSRDRSHAFEALQEVTAKGYANPVMTFKPIFEESVHRSMLQHTASQSSIVNLKSKTPSKFQLLREPSKNRNLLAVSSNDDTFEQDYTGNPNIKTLVASEFHVVNNNQFNQGLIKDNANGVLSHLPRINSGMGKQLKLYGRHLEIYQIFSALFPKNTQGNGHIAFNLQQKSTLVAICGAGGSGKTALLTSIAQKLFSFSRRDAINHNILVLQNRGSSLHSKSPFHTWRPLFSDLLKAIAASHTTIGVNNKRSVRVASTRIIDISGTIDAFFVDAGSETAKLKPFFLLLMGHATKETALEGGKFASSKEKYQLAADVLVKFVDYSRKKVGKLLCFLIEEVQSLDHWSLMVLHQIWTRIPGIAFLVSFSTAQAKDAVTWSHDTYDSPAPVVSSEGSNREGNDSTFDFFKRYNDELRFKSIYLYPLDRLATIKLLQESFDLDETFEEEKLVNIYTVSGGNPLYAVELMKSFLAKHQNNNNNSTNTSNLDTTLLEESTNDVTPINGSTSTLHHRIEEIICFRLDTLESTFQIILKAASVAVSNGHSFTLSLLVFILLESNELSSTDHHSTPTASIREGKVGSSKGDHKYEYIVNSITIALSELLKNDTFIQFAISSGETPQLSGSPGNPNNNDMITIITPEMIRTGNFEFQIPVEQATIYSLLVDEQKEYFHHRVGLYWERKMIRNAQYSKGEMQLETKVQYRLEEAHHWERASNWAKAIQAYVEVGELMKRQDDFKESSWVLVMKSAFRCYRALEREVETKIAPFSNFEAENSKLQYLSKLSSPRDLMTETDCQQLTKELETDIDTLHQLLMDDFDALPSISRMLLALVDIYCKELEDPEFIDSLLQITLKYFLISLNQQYTERRSSSFNCGNEMKEESSEQKSPNLSEKYGSNEMRLSMSLDGDPLAIIRTHAAKRLSSFDTVHFLSTYLFIRLIVRSKRSLLLCGQIKSISNVLLEAVAQLNKDMRGSTSNNISTLPVIDLQARILDLYVSTVTSGTIESEILEKMKELIHQRSQMQGNEIQLLYQTFNQDITIYLFNLIQQKLFANGCLFHYLQFQNQLTSLMFPCELMPLNSSNDNRKRELNYPLSMTVATEIVLLLPYSLILQARGNLNISISAMWFDYYQHLIQDEKILRIFPYQWKRCIDSWIREVDYCYSVYFLHELEGDEAFFAGRLLSMQNNRQQSFQTPTLSQRKFAKSKRNSSIFRSAFSSGTDLESGCVSYTAGVTKYDYRRRAAYFISTMIETGDDSGKIESKSSMPPSYAVQLLRDHNVTMITSQHFNQYFLSHSLCLESMHAQIILSRLFQLLNEPNFDEAKHERTDSNVKLKTLENSNPVSTPSLVESKVSPSSSPESAFNCLPFAFTAEMKQLEQDFIFYWRYLLCLASDAETVQSPNVSTSQTLFSFNYLNLLLPLKLIKQELSYQERVFHPTSTTVTPIKTSSVTHSSPQIDLSKVLQFTSLNLFWKEFSDSIHSQLLPLLKTKFNNQTNRDEDLFVLAWIVDVISLISKLAKKLSLEVEVFQLSSEFIEFNELIQKGFFSHVHEDPTNLNVNGNSSGRQSSPFQQWLKKIESQLQ